MNKEDILRLIKQYNFDNNEYSIISGAALVLYGIKDKTHDIDISVSEEYYKYLLDHYNCVFERINEYNQKSYMIDDIINFGISFMPKRFEIIDGIKVSSLEDIIELKEFLGRKKDINDIKLIKKYKR